MAVDGIKNWGYFTDIELGEYYNPIDELIERGYAEWQWGRNIEESLFETAKKMNKIPSEEDLAICRKPFSSPNKDWLKFCSLLINGKLNNA